jgi:tetratricopeptide (TPR) repeat protein
MIARVGLTVVVLVGLGTVHAAAPPARLTLAQKEQVTQGERWLRRAETHSRAGAIDEAIAALQKGLALERSVFGQVQASSLPWLTGLARLHEQRGRFSAAIRARREVLRRQEDLHGQSDWRVTDARLDVEDTRLLARLDSAQQQRLRQADQWTGQVFQLRQQGRPKEALPLAQKALAARREILGEKHRHTALCWFNLGTLHAALNRVEPARRCHELALALSKEALGE